MNAQGFSTPHEVHAVLDPEPSRAFPQRGLLLSLAGHDPVHLRPQSRDRLEQKIEALEAYEPPHAERDPGALRDRGPGLGRERGELHQPLDIHGVGNHDEAVGGDAEPPHQVVPDPRRHRDHPVRMAEVPPGKPPVKDPPGAAVLVDEVLREELVGVERDPDAPARKPPRAEADHVGLVEERRDHPGLLALAEIEEAACLDP